MLDQIRDIEQEALAALAAASDLDALEAVEARTTGKRGALADVLRGIGKLPGDQRTAVGQAANAARKAVEAALEARRTALEAEREAALGTLEALDLTQPAPGDAPWPRTGGTIHPVQQLIRRVEDVCQGMGFDLLDGPWVEDEQHNFTALNIPPGHPARDMQDTFWLTDGHLLRTHTSPVQIRAMRARTPPIRAVAVGRVFRNEELDATHEHTFHQIEGLLVDREVNVGHMVHVLRGLIAEILESDVEVRLRPAYFPFVEPGFEMDVTYRGRWMELLGCGLVHPDVLRQGGVDPAAWSGFAFGMGIDRLVLLKYGIEDIRHLMGGDLRFLRQFGSGVEA